MFDLYTACCVQLDRISVMHRREIKDKLKRPIELIDWAHRRINWTEYAPVKLIVFPEVFMQGWCPFREEYANVFEKVAKDIAIKIPGEETDVIAETAKNYKMYIAGTAHEVIPEISEDVAFNCAFIISPEGEVVYKYHKYSTYITNSTGVQQISPHDMYDKYLKVMDGTYGRKKGDILSCFFPVVDTEIGKLGYIICNDGYTFENSRAMAVQGCEVMLRSSGILEPEASFPEEQWEITNRAPAFYNLMYVVACGPGDSTMPKRPTNATPGHSMIVDFHGAMIKHVTYPGETVTSAVINIDMLRRRRMEHRQNWIPQMRMDAYREIYKNPIYPINAYSKRLPYDALKVGEREVDKVPMKMMIEKGIFTAPTPKKSKK